MRAPATFDSVVVAAVVRDLRPHVGSRLRAVRQPGSAEIALELRGEGAATILLSAHARWGRIHLTPPLPRDEAGPFVQMLRARLTGSRLAAIEQPPFERAVTLRFDTDAGTSELVAEVMGRHSNLILVQDGVIAGALKLIDRTQSSVREILPGRRFVPAPRDRQPPGAIGAADLAALLAAGDGPLVRVLTAAVLGIGPATARELCAWAGLDPDAATGRAVAVERLSDALLKLARIVRAEAFHPILYLVDGRPAGYAPFPFEHLLAHPQIAVPTMSEAVAEAAGRLSADAEVEEQRRTVSGTIRSGLRKVEHAAAEIARALDDVARAPRLRAHGELLLAYASQIPAGSAEARLPGFEGETVSVPMDPTLSAVENAQQLFARYARLRDARPQLEARLSAMEEERRYLESAMAMVDAATGTDDLAALSEDLVDERHPSRPRRRPPAPPKPRVFLLPGGGQIVVGRSNHDNDRLTFKLAGPEDLWFHARGVPGAHVILRTEGRDPTPSEIAVAAAAAAYFSAARHGGSAAVDYTRRKYVRKPKGSKPGMVTYQRESTVQAVPRVPEPPTPAPR